MPTAIDVIKKVSDELTSHQPYGSGLHIYAPHIVELGMQLIAITPQIGGGRDDVHRFSHMMATIMNIKDQHKGPVTAAFTTLDALGGLAAQYNKLLELPTPTGNDLRRILIHIANFAMIAEYKMADAAAVSVWDVGT